MTHAILILWIALGQAQSISMIDYPSLAQCEAAKIAIKRADRRFRWVECVPYSWSSEQ